MKRLTPFLFLLAVAVPMSGAESDPGEKLRSTVRSAMDVVYASDYAKEERKAKVLDVLEANYDLNVIIRRAMGRNWRLLEEGEKTKVTRLIKQLVAKAFVDNLDGGERPEVTFGEVVTVTESRLEIPSTVRTGGEVYEVLYRMGRLRSGWQIYDIVAEDISLVSNYREQLNEHFRKGNGQQLVEKLENMLEKETINEPLEI